MRQHKVNTSSKPAFTLVELLVVITIIVVLLALLVPALDRAIYQAELVVCASNVRNIALTVTRYALDHRRTYPRRAGIGSPFWQPQDLNLAGHPLEFEPTDERTKLRPYMSLNKDLNCPLTAWIDIEGSRSSSWIQVPYALWFGWRFTGEGGGEGMDRIGSRMEYFEHGFSVLASDHEVISEKDRWGHGAHPDINDGKWVNVALQDGSHVGAPAVGAPHALEGTLSRWSGQHDRGPIDMNFAFQDGSVERLVGVRWDETRGESGRMARVPYVSGFGRDPTDEIPGFWAHLRRN
jgi:prepilin-type N-terminal cleavage/methylation domain-containing protein/prepilin-type processing-associated H-X9-DG protein